jgi:hypothetical protein
MATEKKSFSDLLGEAPLATSEKTISLTGVLARSNEPGKFVLTTGDNQSVTLDISAVKEHKVLSGMIGQTVVQIEVDRDKVPAGEAGQGVGRPIKLPTFDQTIAYRDVQYTVPWDPWSTDVLTDVHKIPYVDQHPYKQINEATGTIMENVVNPGNFGVDPGVAQGFAPFALATPHQAPQEMLAGAVPPYQGPNFGGPMGPGTFRTSPIYDLRTNPFLDKNPILDITGHFPYPD